MSKKVALLSNEHSWTYNLRKETIARLLDNGYSVTLILPYGEKVELLKEMGCSFIDVPMFERRGKNPLKELRLIIEYHKILKKEKPDVVLTYTIKPNLYGGMVCSLLKIPYISNITGLGSAVEKSGLISSLAKILYKVGLRKASYVFAQNKSNKDYLINNKIVAPERVKQIAGSGVNLSRFEVSEYPEDNATKFVFISRLLKEKGIEDYIEAAKIVKARYPLSEFHVCGFCEEEYKEHLSSLKMEEYVVYHGMIDNVPQFLKGIHCLVHPSYYLEGTSNVCLEACASGRPVITTDHEGCRETVVDGKTGFIVPVKSPEVLAAKIIEFIEMPYESKKEMGLAARKHVEENFDRNVIVREYMDAIKRLDI
ncbi:MAG: glycosyltransferase family 4 protein [Clostridia bacterium]|nr:glycosyltransferase family 4 protein [Clostridia bacterium]